MICFWTFSSLVLIYCSVFCVLLYVLCVFVSSMPVSPVTIHHIVCCPQLPFTTCTRCLSCMCFWLPFPTFPLVSLPPCFPLDCSHLFCFSLIMLSLCIDPYAPLFLVELLFHDVVMLFGMYRCLFSRVPCLPVNIILV